MGTADTENHHMIKHGFKGLRNKGLQFMRFDGQLSKFRHLPQPGSITRYCKTDLLSTNAASGGFKSGDLAVFPGYSGDFAILDNIHALHVRTSGISPGYRIMTCITCTLLNRGPNNREARILIIKMWYFFFQRGQIPKLTIAVGKAHGVISSRSPVPSSRGVK